MGLRCLRETYLDPEMLISKKYGHKNGEFTSKKRVLWLSPQSKWHAAIKNRRRPHDHVVKINIIIIFMVIKLFDLNKSNSFNTSNKDLWYFKIFSLPLCLNGFSIITALADIISFLKFKISSWKNSPNSLLTSPHPTITGKLKL